MNPATSRGDVLVWRLSTYTASGSSCVAVADAVSGVAVRNSIHPDEGTIVVPHPTFGALLAATKAGELDDLML